jgi:hypothetical protein
MKRRAKILFAVLLVPLAGALAWFLWASGLSSSWGPDRLFRGRPEQYWVTNVAYSPGDGEIKQWQEFGHSGRGGFAPKRQAAANALAGTPGHFTILFG